MRIPEHTIEEIRTAADIIEIVSGFVRLKKAGRNFIGLCPFHQEKTPSFMVNQDKGIFKCFGCGRGGNVFSFLMDMEKISFIESVQELAEKYHITIVADAGPSKPVVENLDALYESVKFAARFFYDTLQSDAGKPGREYFTRRKWTTETQRKFGLGFAANEWTALLEAAKAGKLQEDVLETAGLIIKRDDNRRYDRFRNRIIFPIFSVTKKVIGFGARTMQAEEQPKYLNSPETPIYNKSKVLYGLSHAVKAIRDKDAVIIVEGYADTLSMHQAGIEHVIATSGTALTPDQVRILRRYTRNFFFLYDADSAGFNAMLRGLDIILEQDCDARVVQLPTGEDPDSYVQKKGRDAIEEQLSLAVSFVDFITARYQQQGLLENPEGKTQAIRHIVGMLAKMDDKIRREMYLHHIADKYRIYENLLYQELDTLLKKKKRTAPQQIQQPPEEPEELPELNVPKEIPRAEKAFLSQLLLAEPEIQAEALDSVHIEYFRHPYVRHLLHLLLEQREHEGMIDANKLWPELTDKPQLGSLLAELLMKDEDTSPGWKKYQTIHPQDVHRALFDEYRQILTMFLNEKRKTVSGKLHGLAGKTDAEFATATAWTELLRIGRVIDFAQTFEDLRRIGDEMLSNN